MNPEDKTIACADKTRDFGVMGDLLRELQREEMEETKISAVEVPESRITQSTADLMAEISATLKEIAETQKSILEEIKRSR